MTLIQPRRLAVGTLSLVAAGAIGGAVAFGLGTQDSNQRPVELQHVAETATAPATPTATATTAARPSPTATTTATPKVTRVVRPAAPKVQPVAPAEPAPAPVKAAPQQVAPEPVEPSPAASVPSPPPILSIPDTTEPPSGQHG